MADWTNIGDSFLEPGKPVRSVDGLALRDNPIAIAEGAAGAPRIVNAAVANLTLGAEKFQTPSTNERDWVLGATALGLAGSVGSYVYAEQISGQSVAFGGTIAGSSIAPPGSSGPGAPLSGTWRCMGLSSIGGVAVWLRIS